MMLETMRDAAQMQNYTVIKTANNHIVIDIPASCPDGITLDFEQLWHKNFDAQLSSQVDISVHIADGTRVTLYDMNFFSTKNELPVDQLGITYHIGAGAQVDIVTIQDSATHKIITLKERFISAADSSLSYSFVVMGGATVQRSLAFILDGVNAVAQVRGIYSLSGEQRLMLTTRQQHEAANTDSDLCIKGALIDTACAEYNGTIVVGHKATQSRSNQQNKNLLLSAGARARSIPNLEVLTNDVQCAHGSAVGQLDSEQLLYMASRGLSYDRAKKLLLEGFFADTLENVPTAVRSAVLKRIITRIVE